MITQTQNNAAATANKGAMDSSSNSNGFGGSDGDDMQNKPLPSFQK